MAEGRYQRHSMIDWFDQDQVRAMRVIVIGAGAAGNEVIKNLALLGVGTIEVFDFDCIEETNLTRSVLFREGDIGRPKAVCAAERARERDPALTINAHVGDFWDLLSLQRLQLATCVFCCVDSYFARMRANKLCALMSVDLVEIGLDSRYASVSYFPFSLGDQAACYECGLPDSAYVRLSQRYSCGWLRRVCFQERKIPTTILTSSGAGSAAVSLFLHSRFAQDPEMVAVQVRVDTVSGCSARTFLRKKDTCPVCSALRPKRLLLRAKNRIESIIESLPPEQSSGESSFTTSDQIVVSYRTVNCPNRDPDEIVPVLCRASDLDETFVVCPDCGLPRRQVTIKDQFDPQELLQYKGRRLPAKFLMAIVDDVQFILELEE